MHATRFWITASFCLVLAACASTSTTTQSLRLTAQDKLAVLPFVNATEAPQVQERAQAITVALLQQKGLAHVLVYPQEPSDNPLQAQPAASSVQTLDWARNQGARYALSGTVTEWRYKTGVDSEPAVGLTLQIADVHSGQVVWSAAGARSGWGYQALAAVGQAQIAALLGGLQVQVTARTPASAAARPPGKLSVEPGAEPLASPSAARP
ncbi:MAG: penicillin-binding protein activator LpoB [Burkholderiales bacterium]|nr:penicillin-binding protein activator LpoB [Burkholderiales bacterium]